MKIDTPPTTGTMGGDPDVAPFMAARGWLEPGERAARAARAGEGNMNRVLRVTTTARSLILKQARPWVEKYPQLAAPVERAEVEAAFYRAVASVPEVAARMPRLLASDPESHAILFKDLGDGGDFNRPVRRRAHRGGRRNGAGALARGTARYAGRAARALREPGDAGAQQRACLRAAARSGERARPRRDHAGADRSGRHRAARPGVRRAGDGAGADPLRRRRGAAARRLPPRKLAAARRADGGRPRILLPRSARMGPRRDGRAPASRGRAAGDRRAGRRLCAAGAGAKREWLATARGLVLA